MKKEIQVIADNLIRIAEEHKKSCAGDCNISLFLVGKAYEKIVNRKLTKKEFNIFS